MSGNVNAGRNTGFDALRIFMIVLVVGLHAAMTYMAYVPPWWYVIDSRKSIVFTALVIALDSFPMSVLFFLAGYFAPASLAKRGAWPFVRDKLLRLGLPWVVGVVAVAPFLAKACMLSLGLPSPTLGELWHMFFLGPWYQQGHYWFLGVLLLFMTALALWPTKAAKTLPSDDTATRPALLIAAVFIAGMLTYMASVAWIMPTDEWLSVGRILYFQPARFVGYAGIFALGVHAGRRGWFRPGGWLPGRALLGLVALGSLGLRVAWVLLGAGMMEAGGFASLALNAATYTIPALMMPLFLCAAFAGEGRRREAISKYFSPYGYGIYWLHQMILLPLLYIFTAVPLPAVVLWLMAITVTLAIGRFLTVKGLKRIPFFGRAF